MPKEFHQIVFSLKEVVGALDAYRRNHADFLPPGPIQRHALSGSKLTLSIEMPYAGNRQLLDFTLDANQLIDPMIKFCAENNIVVPRADRRVMKFDNEELILELVAAATEAAPVVAMVARPMPQRHAGA
jgi:hypothetical protein